MRKILISTGICLFLLTAGCSVHRLDVQQGNIIDGKTLDKLKAGMSKKQVIYLLGTPVLQDPFHPNRWDYIYTFKSGENNTVEKKNLTLYFKGDSLQKFENQGYPNTKQR
ncbi:MAG: outer membrane protein assembly factor BamE [Gammaproteobacteria bacterium]|nr:outer membrane protein assembly factor BamE [Gammaproteobacteria bacterium]MDH5652235.1 outer membrane protein assembly factor BamE [Gammaproteobacteria bacterium]